MMLRSTLLALVIVVGQGCRGWRPRDRTASGPLEAIVTEFRAALTARDPARIWRLLTPACRSGCKGFSPVVVSPQEEAMYQTALWTRRLKGGSLAQDLATALWSYATVDRLDLAPVWVQRYDGRVVARLLMAGRGVDQAGHRRVDRGYWDLIAVRQARGWRLDQLSPVQVVTMRRTEAGRPVPYRPANLARRGRFRPDDSDEASSPTAASEPRSGGVSADFNRDGVLERVAWSNRRSASRGLPICAGDLDGDGDVDLVMQEVPQHPVVLRINCGDSHFSRVVVGASVRSTPGLTYTGCAVGDIDSDGQPDVALSVEDGLGTAAVSLLMQRHARHRGGRRSQSSWELRQLRNAGGGIGGKISLVDHDNDGDLDVWVARRPGVAQLWINVDHAKFLVEGAWLGGQIGQERGTAPAHRVLVHLTGRQTGNRAAIGARVSLRADGRRQVREVGLASGVVDNPPGYAHFGLGSSVRVEELDVLWPDGQRQRFIDLPVDYMIDVRQGEQPLWEPISTDPDETDDAVADLPQAPPGGDEPATQEDTRAVDARTNALRDLLRGVLRQERSSSQRTVDGRDRSVILVLVVGPDCRRCRSWCATLEAIRKDAHPATRLLFVAPKGRQVAKLQCALPRAELGADGQRQLAVVRTLLPLVAIVQDDCGKAQLISLAEDRPLPVARLEGLLGGL